MRRWWCGVRAMLAAVLALALLVLPGPATHGAMATSGTLPEMAAEHCADGGSPAPTDGTRRDHRSLPACCTAAPCAPSLGTPAPLALPTPASVAVRRGTAPSTRKAGISLPPSVPPPRRVA